MPYFPTDLQHVLTLLALAVFAVLFFRLHQQQPTRYSRRVVEPPTAETVKVVHQRRKPDWVLREVLRLKALMGKHVGCRKIANTFNRLHAPATVGKTFVAEAIKNHQCLLMTIARDLRDKRPLPVPINGVWALDLTFVNDAHRATHTCIGILDHGSRFCTRLTVLLNKRSWTLLGHLCLAIGKYGKPQAVRTDNEAVFTSFVFRTFLRLVGIKRQTTPVAAPWMNGRVERFFGTVKPWLKALIIPGALALQSTLDETRLFYNHVRTHQNLDGITPAEALQGMTPLEIRGTHIKTATLVQALDGVLVGYHLRQ